MKLAIVGGGWAGMAAAVAAAAPDVELTVFEAARELGGRARALDVGLTETHRLRLDNGQHILIGAYTETLNCMQRVGVPLTEVLLPLPLGLPFPDGSGLRTADWAARWPATPALLLAIGSARGWAWRDRLALLKVGARWRGQGFDCPGGQTARDVCQGLTPRVMADLIDPLCVSALNLPAAQASGQVFLRVMHDALLGPGFGPWPASTLLLPRVDLGALFPNAAASWLRDNLGGAFQLRLGTRVDTIQPDPAGWRLRGAGLDRVFHRVVWATSAGTAARTMQQAAQTASATGATEPARALGAWASTCAALPFTAIATVYAHSPGARLPRPMLALRDTAGAPAQFVFDRGQLAPHEPFMQGVLAFVVSACEGDRSGIEQAVLRQARQQLGLGGLQPLQTVVERRATFACLPELRRPGLHIAPGLCAAGDLVEGPYPATLEAAVRSGLAAVRRLREMTPPAH
ncbi:MAG TPA: FAD-dependent oxidoreductase [Hydrogenophaga sp.]|nr:FAD-dependent oxidoreductase [Hydrogenophaga sp.]HMP09136.1 FAD-dependent oxidoreductase [Hydrogenophaga sp.]